ncbi:Fe-S cluster assembly sulfur transfer protein SufU [uncultured Clostridium sp.]|uniref:Fe-S cluster assembly sulfur transfer protein SufU n=1 Tax=uncultured Clostridium sp. TaxID=59620 RepID=UPI0025F95FA0|nr:SUF system NifU family Fe-S cluster assembly protein [uncultured Clostridium sp.]
MSNRTFYNEILTEHNLNPIHKRKMENPDLILEGVNPNCGDDIYIQLKMDGDRIIDGSFSGSGCAISQASADIMLDIIIGKNKDEAFHLIDLFMKMIRGNITENELEELEEACSLEDISHMPARVKCAVLSWHTLEEMLGRVKEERE